MQDTANSPIPLRPSALATEPVEALPRPVDVALEQIAEIRTALGLDPSATHAATVERVRAQRDAVSAYTAAVLQHADERRTFVNGSEAQMVRALGAAAGHDDDDAGRIAHMFALGCGDVRSGALETISAINELVRIVTIYERVGVDDGPLKARWNHLFYFLGELAETAGWFGQLLDTGRREAVEVKS